MIVFRMLAGCRTTWPPPNVFETVALWMLVAAAFSLTLPTAWISVFLILYCVCWALSVRFRRKWELVRANPAALAALALFALYGLGTLYSPVPASDALAVWGKYHKLLYIPLIVSLLDDPVWRRRAADGFFWGMLLTLGISYLKWLGWYPHQDIGEGYFVFKGRIAHNIFMAFTVYLALERAYQDCPRRWLWTGIALLAAANVVFLVNGRTGQLLLPCLLILFAWTHGRWRVALGAATGGGVVVLVAIFVLPTEVNEASQARIFQIRQEIQIHQPQGSEQTSSGQRLEFYRNTLALIRERPGFGWGTGSLQSVYAAYAHRQGFALTQVTNPHNEYLLTLQQLGLTGLAVLLFMGWRHWWAAGELVDAGDGGCLRALIVLMGIGALFNSLLLDAGEGKLYCLMAGIYLSGWVAPGARGSIAHAAC